MDSIFAPLVLVLLLLFGLYIGLIAYFFVWFCGPAIRRAGKCWEQGRMKAAAEERGWAPWGYVSDPRANRKPLANKIPRRPPIKRHSRIPPDVTTRAIASSGDAYGGCNRRN